MKDLVRLGIGLGVPVLATLASIPVVEYVHGAILGVPVVIAMALALFVLTTGCMAACWWLWDRHGV